MAKLFDVHERLLKDAVRALEVRTFWTPFPEAPSGKVYGETAKADGLAAFEALLGRPLEIEGHPGMRRAGKEVSPWERELGISYPSADPETLVSAARAAGEGWAAASAEDRVGVCLEILVRLNAMSFLMGHATMHTTGQAFPMAFQAGGPHAQDRGLEAVAMAWAEMTRSARDAVWEKPQGKAAPIVMEKHWSIVPRGVGLVIACQTFPTWNSYPGLFADLATGNTVLVKPHPRAILPLALTVRVAREVLAEAGFPADVVLLAADEPGAEVTKGLVTHPDVRLIDFTGSNAFATWIRANAADAQVFTEEAGVNSIVVAGTDDFAGMCANVAFSLSLYSGQMCTAPQNIYVPRDGIETDEGHKSFGEVAGGIAGAIDTLLSDPIRAAGICGTIADPDTLRRVEDARDFGRVVRDSTATGEGRSATPLIVIVEGGPGGPQESECFGPVSFIVPVADAFEGIDEAARLAAEKGAITAAIYAMSDGDVEHAARAFAASGVNLSVSLTGNIYVNQSAAFSDYHVTGANPAGNATLTDAAFVAPRFRRVMLRKLRAA